MSRLSRLELGKDRAESRFCFLKPLSNSNNKEFAKYHALKAQLRHITILARMRPMMCVRCMHQLLIVQMEYSHQSSQSKSWGPLSIAQNACKLDNRNHPIFPTQPIKV